MTEKYCCLYCAWCCERVFEKEKEYNYYFCRNNKIRDGADIKPGDPACPEFESAEINIAHIKYDEENIKKWLERAKDNDQRL